MMGSMLGKLCDFELFMLPVLVYLELLVLGSMDIDYDGKEAIFP